MADGIERTPVAKRTLRKMTEARGQVTVRKSTPSEVFWKTSCSAAGLRRSPSWIEERLSGAMEMVSAFFSTLWAMLAECGFVPRDFDCVFGLETKVVRSRGMLWDGNG